MGIERTLIKDARVVGAEGVIEADVLLEDGWIAKIGPGQAAGTGVEEVVAAGKHLFPGLIDDQVHFREPGMTHKGRIASESRAAVRGGITSYLEMPNTVPPAADGAGLEAKYAIAARDSLANYSFYLGATGSNGAELRRAAEYGACGVKVFLAASTGPLLVAEPEALEEVFAAVPPGMVLAAHCEDQAALEASRRHYAAEYGRLVPMALHPGLRDEDACLAATRRAMELARRHGTRLHVLHLTTAKELELFEPGGVGAKQITAEACVHHLWFSDRDYAALGGRIKCNPAIKAPADRAALRAAVRDGRIDAIATDHAPHVLAEKEGRVYGAVAAGLPLVQHSLQLLLELARRGELRLEDIARLGAQQPAELFGIEGRGAVREGWRADLALADLDRGATVSRDSLAYRAGWSPLEGVAFSASVREVWVGGVRKLRAGALVEAGPGERLACRPRGV